MIMIVAWLHWLPTWLGAPAKPLVHTGAVLSLLGLWILISLVTFRDAYRASHFPVGRGPDFFLGDRRCQFADPLLEEIRQRLHPGETLCVLPEGILINYLARVDSSVPFLHFDPFAIQVFGELSVLESFSAHPPDYVVLWHRNTSEYGPALFGRDYGQALYSWVRRNYDYVAEWGRAPDADGGHEFVLMVLKSTRGRANAAVTGVAAVAR
jgi:hypothetical protein